MYQGALILSLLNLSVISTTTENLFINTTLLIVHVSMIITQNWALVCYFCQWICHDSRVHAVFLLQSCFLLHICWDPAGESFMLKSFNFSLMQNCWLTGKLRGLPSPHQLESTLIQSAPVILEFSFTVKWHRAIRLPGFSHCLLDFYYRVLSGGFDN